MKAALALLLLLFAHSCFAGTAPDSDRAVVEELYAKCVRALIEFPGHEPGMKTAIRFSGGIVPSARLKNITDAIFSASGFSIAEEGAPGAYEAAVSISDPRCALRKEGRSYRRFCALTVHVRFADVGGKVLFADGREETFTDLIPKSYIRDTNDLADFPGAPKRFVEGGHGGLRVVSLLLISAALGYFAFR
jgi:hypothetical protein